MKKHLALLLLLVLSFKGMANMASPVTEGTKVSDAFSSRDIDILHEQLEIVIDSSFQHAFYTITYTINTQQEGPQVPLLFYALNYKDSFNVWVDDMPVALKDIPKAYTGTDHTFLERFDVAIGKGHDQALIYWEPNTAQYYALNDLKYFEADLPKGQHTIRVTYTSVAWADISGWITEYSHHYSLSPAQYWKSFAELDIVLSLPGGAFPVHTNLGAPQQGRLDSVARWHFSYLPADCIVITYQPRVSALARILIAIGQQGFMLIAAVLLTVVHIYLMWRYRKKYPQKKISPVWIAGSFIVPALALLSTLPASLVIDAAIGKEARMPHGYDLLIFFLYPIALPLYFVIAWLAERLVRQRLTKQKATM